MTDDAVKPTLLVIADISGYTEFMVASSIEIKHSQHIITQLIQTIIEQVEIPLKVSKLEGDAIFLYAVKDQDDETWQHVRNAISTRLLRFFNVFHDKLAELRKRNDCCCGACANLGELRLKLVVHSGEALFYRIAEFNELSGEDVILVHRLLKNSVPKDEYILITDSAWCDLHFPANRPVDESSEYYEHLGNIHTRIYYPLPD